jgi:hypothetical protein
VRAAAEEFWSLQYPPGLTSFDEELAEPPVAANRQSKTRGGGAGGGASAFYGLRGDRTWFTIRSPADADADPSALPGQAGGGGPFARRDAGGELGRPSSRSGSVVGLARAVDVAVDEEAVGRYARHLNVERLGRSVLSSSYPVSAAYRQSCQLATSGTASSVSKIKSNFYPYQFGSKESLMASFKVGVEDLNTYIVHVTSINN